MINFILGLVLGIVIGVVGLSIIAYKLSKKS
jgi:hypothetical protein